MNIDRRIALLLLVVLGSLNAFKTYEGYHVFQVDPTSRDHLKFLRNLESVVDFWKKPLARHTKCQFAVAPDAVDQTKRLLQRNGIKFKILVEDLSPIVAESHREISSSDAAFDDIDSFAFDKYHSFADMMSYIEAVAEEHAEFVSIGSLGKSCQGRDIKYLKIGYPSAKPKNMMFIDAGIHAREWIAPSTALFAIRQLVTNTTLRSTLEAIDIFIAPNVNPDGYEYSRAEERMWRKTRSGPRGPFRCYGADANRNFPFKWDVSGASPNPCNDAYSGPSPLSEVESANLAQFISSYRSTLKTYLTLHSFGQQLLFPWGYASDTFPPDALQLIRAADAAAAAIARVNGTEYTVESGGQLYPAAGASDDFAKSIGIPFVYTIELRPSQWDHFGFILPERFIVPTAEETFPGLMTFAEYTRKGPFD